MRFKAHGSLEKLRVRERVVETKKREGSGSRESIAGCHEKVPRGTHEGDHDLGLGALRIWRALALIRRAPQEQIYACVCLYQLLLAAS